MHLLHALQVFEQLQGLSEIGAGAPEFAKDLSLPLDVLGTERGAGKQTPFRSFGGRPSLDSVPRSAKLIIPGKISK